MKTEKLTTAELRRMNRKKVYEFIYTEGHTSKQELVRALQLSLPTVTQNLNELESSGLIEKTGFLESTGGRKAQMFSCRASFRIALGLEIQKDFIWLTAIDLYGTILKEASVRLPFAKEERYFKKTGEWVTAFLAELDVPEDHILGIGIAMQGLVCAEGKNLIYSKILNCTGVQVDDFARYLKLPRTLIHDAKAAAFAELWFHRGITDAVYLSLNRNLGGAVILNGEIYQGRSLISGTFEHMCLVPDGKPCYCGKKGCAEVYCSADSLILQAREQANFPEDGSEDPFELFFRKLRDQDPEITRIWDGYLRNLALAVSNIRHVIDTDLIISGLLHTYFRAEDYEKLTQLVQDCCVFPAQPPRLIPGQCPRQAAAIGAGLYYIHDFLQTI